MSWYKVWMVVPGTDGDAESGPCEPQWWNDMVQAEDEPMAITAANAKARADWEDSDGECPCGKELGIECPVCTGAQAVTDEEHTAWVKQMEISSRCPLSKKTEYTEAPALRGCCSLLACRRAGHFLCHF